MPNELSAFKIMLTKINCLLQVILNRERWHSILWTTRMSCFFPAEINHSPSRWSLIWAWSFKAYTYSVCSNSSTTPRTDKIYIHFGSLLTVLLMLHVSLDRVMRQREWPCEGACNYWHSTITSMHSSVTQVTASNSCLTRNLSGHQSLLSAETLHVLQCRNLMLSFAWCMHGGGHGSCGTVNI